jgi:NAD(P)-dependent dehydrogenase (short-subunit alcohol dehydrogenase family)
VVRLTAALAHLKEEAGIRVNCICPVWVETPAVQRALSTMTSEEKAALPFPPPGVLIQPGEIAEAVLMFVGDDTLAGRVMVWPDGEARRLVPVDARY